MDTLQVGRRLLPVEHIALVEAYEPEQNKAVKSERVFQARLTLIDRSSVLIEESVATFAEKHGFRMLVEDNVGTNPVLHFSVESFEATHGFEATKPYKTRLSWRDFDDAQQSKLLLTVPETVLAIAVRGLQPPKPEAAAAETTVRPSKRRSSPPPIPPRGRPSSETTKERALFAALTEPPDPKARDRASRPLGSRSHRAKE